jgi:hypothetical protein
MMLIQGGVRGEWEGGFEKMWLAAGG